jgi:hypothetical protein
MTRLEDGIMSVDNARRVGSSRWLMVLGLVTTMMCAGCVDGGDGGDGGDADGGDVPANDAKGIIQVRYVAVRDGGIENGGDRVEVDAITDGTGRSRISTAHFYDDGEPRED